MFAQMESSSVWVLTHHGELGGSRRDHALGFGVLGPACVLSGFLPEPELLDLFQGQNGTFDLHDRLVVVPAEGGGRVGAGRTGQAEVGSGFDDRGRVRWSDGDVVGSVCGVTTHTLSENASSSHRLKHHDNT